MPPYLYDLVSIQVSLLVVTTHAFHITLGYSDQTIFITQSLIAPSNMLGTSSFLHHSEFLIQINLPLSISGRTIKY